MEWFYPNSSAIQAIGYNGTTLAVVFHNSGRYDHYGVSESVWRRFINASSHGRYYNENIRGRY
ncbi:MAG: KTSC domain-containing protein [Verrucomicrobiae bacterium]|nr:KTSC domain-containing protein [Verrucomicrobiae bacterium]